MLDPNDYQNTNGVSSGVTNYMDGMGSQQPVNTGGQNTGGQNGNWLQQAGSWLGSDSKSQGMGIGGGMSNDPMILAADQMGGQLFGMLAKQNETKVGNIMKSIPGLSTVGNLTNAAFGSHINKEFVKQTENMSNSLGSRTFNGNTNAGVLNDWKSFVEQSHVRKREVGSEGWFSNKASHKRNKLNEAIDRANELQLLNYGIAVNNADRNTDLRIAQGMYAAYGGPINSFRKYYEDGGSFSTPQFFTFEPQIFDDGGYLSQAKALIRQNEGWREKPYKDAPKGKNWRSVGYGFNDSGFREKYPEGISKHYEHGITKKQAEEELDYFLNKAEKQLKSIYGKQWNDFTDSQKAAILDTYYQRPASVGKQSRFYKAVTAGEDPSKYLGVAGFKQRNNIRQSAFRGGKFTGQVYSESSNTEDSLTYPSSILETTSPLVDYSEAFSGVTPTQAKAPELNLTTPNIDFLASLGRPTQPTQPVPTVGTVEDFLARYDDYNIFAKGGGMDFSNAWNSAQGGSQGAYSSNWKPSDGLQKNTSNGNAQDWVGVAGTTINTIGNWGKEDPSLGRGGGYSNFGMATYDLMKAIRDATKSRRESIDQKLGIPIYARGGRLFADGGEMSDSEEGVGAMGYAQVGTAALKLASNAKHQASLDDNIDVGAIHRSINRYGMGLDEAVADVNTNGDLLDLWQNNSTINPNLSTRDFRNKSYFDDFLNGFAASWEGFNAGQNFGPWGAAIGAVAGGLSSNIASIIGRHKAKKAANRANAKIETANERRMGNLLAAAERVDQENDFRMLQNMGANGGKLNMGFNLRSPFIMPDGTATPLYRAFGGGLTHKVGDIINVSPEEARYLKSLGYEFNTVG